MEEPLSPLDQKALAAKSDPQVASDLYREVELLLVSRLATWRSRFDEDTIESLQGEAFVKALQGFEAGRAPFVAYLLSVAYNTLRSHHRDSQRPNREFQENMVSLEQIGDIPSSPGLPSLKASIPGREPAASEALDRAELQEAIEDAICGYSADSKCRDLLRDVAFKGLGTFEAADARGLRRSYAVHHMTKFRAFAAQHSGMKEMNANDLPDDEEDWDE